MRRIRKFLRVWRERHPRDREGVEVVNHGMRFHDSPKREANPIVDITSPKHDLLVCSREDRKESQRHIPRPDGSIPKYKFSFMPGFFVDYEEVAKQCPNEKSITQPRLGIVERDYGALDLRLNAKKPRLQWTRFKEYVEYLNRHCSDGESYKVLYLVRHGLSVHNIIMEKVGSKAWKEYWSHQDGNGEVNWVDAPLVDEGVIQARTLAEFWTNSVRDDEMPLPGTIYTSPLARCLETTKLVYEGVTADSNRSFRPIVKEQLRERLTNHTCDRRSSRSWIANNYPGYSIEEGFTENDVLWKDDTFETPEDHVARKQRFLEDIFFHDDSSFVSLTLHSYAISAILGALGEAEFRVAEGAIVPLFMKGFMEIIREISKTLSNCPPKNESSPQGAQCYVSIFSAAASAPDMPEDLMWVNDPITTDVLFDKMEKRDLFHSALTSPSAAALDLIFFPDSRWKSMTRPDSKKAKTIFDYLRLDHALFFYLLSSRSGWYMVANGDGSYSFMMKDYLYMLAWSFNPSTMETRAILTERSDYTSRSSLKMADGKFNIPGLKKVHLYHPLSLACIGLADTVFNFDFLVADESVEVGKVETDTGHGLWVKKQSELQQLQQQQKDQVQSHALPQAQPQEQEQDANTKSLSGSTGTGSSSDAKNKQKPKLHNLMEASRNIARIIGTFANLWKSVGIAHSIVEDLGDKGWEQWFKEHNTDSECQRAFDQCATSLREATKLLSYRIKTIEQSGRAIDNRAQAQSGVISALIRREDTRVGHEIARLNHNLAVSSTTIAYEAQKDSADMKTIAMMTMAFLPATFFAALFSVPSLDWRLEKNTAVITNNFWVYWVFTIPTTIIVFVTWDFFNNQRMFSKLCSVFGIELEKKEKSDIENQRDQLNELKKRPTFDT